MLSKAIFKKLDEYLKKHEGPWLTENFEERDDSSILLRGHPALKAGQGEKERRKPRA